MHRLKCTPGVLHGRSGVNAPHRQRKRSTTAQCARCLADALVPAPTIARRAQSAHGSRSPQATHGACNMQKAHRQHGVDSTWPELGSGSAQLHHSVCVLHAAARQRNVSAHPAKYDTRQRPASASSCDEECSGEPSTEGEGLADDDTDAEAHSRGVSVALSVLRFYKRGISPLLPPSCRFIPTCSEYAMDAYKEHGVGRGTILTAWRLMRCNPFGAPVVIALLHQHFTFCRSSYASRLVQAWKRTAAC